MTKQITKLIDELANLFAQSQLPIAQIGKEACEKCRDKNIIRQNERKPLETHREIKKFLGENNTLNKLPIANTIVEVMDDLNWYYSGYEDGRINENVALRMQTCEIIGPNVEGSNTMIDYHECRVGLFAQTAHTNYTTRNHAAEELFVKIAGQAKWKNDKENYITKNAGEFIHHKSLENHASQTIEYPLIAAWIWSGDVDYKKYYYKDT